ncbi:MULTISPECIES: hypothetical protein [Methylomonas]|uniref:Uncharacterized protein n=1 Tax=Methylomonas koyamae TaxID=702114 RepID=A0A177N1K6_9GAMM|nr:MULTISPECIES: hypothetical protein [Methylomonas]NJA05672.1 hypothetical protein [Methylococcaceae bacterium WWC4]OAI11857.1 hypothetical protein A1355_15295 [Methylomonas koyamae]WGS86717.1 hypothetical protein QC632_02905 [Methylomonas sp. UP202]
MAELLFIATTIFVAYVVFVVMGDKKPKPSAAKPEAAITPAPEPKASQAEAISPPPVPTEKPATPRPSTRKTAAKPAAPAQAAAPTATADSVKNPKTGEVAKISGNYAFAKRWIKDALVEEGLLDKVYKNNELDEAATTKIQAALQQLAAMDKYR